MNLESPNLRDPQLLGRERRAVNLQVALAPLACFLEDAGVVEVLVNADGNVWMDKLGSGLQPTGVRMAAGEAERMVRAIAGVLQLELHADKPSMACQLPSSGARVQVLVPPIVRAPIVALRKRISSVLRLEDYIEQRVLTIAQADVLRAAVLERANVLIGGGTGSGKTTFANALLQEIAQTTDRVLIIEDTPELQCPSADRVELLVRPPHYTWRHAVMDALRLRPDRIIVGEVRDAAALDLLKAMNTGHPGTVATLHADDTRAMLDRFAQLVDEAVPMYPRTVIADTIDVCVHLARDRKHRAGRVITGMERVIGHDAQRGWQLEPLWRVA